MKALQCENNFFFISIQLSEEHGTGRVNNLTEKRSKLEIKLNANKILSIKIKTLK